MRKIENYLFERVIDLTHELENGMPYYPGDPAPSFERYKTLEKDGVKITKIIFGSHTGTHIDAPARFIPECIGVDKISVASLICKGVLLDVSNVKIGNPITLQDVAKHRDKIRSGIAVVFYTGWSKEWGRKLFYNYTYLSKDVASFLASSKVICVGIDTPSVEQFGSREYVVHKTLLSSGIHIVELLSSSVKKLAGKNFLFIALPLKLKNSDGSPCRAVAIPIVDKVVS